MEDPTFLPPNSQWLLELLIIREESLKFRKAFRSKWTLPLIAIELSMYSWHEWKLPGNSGPYFLVGKYLGERTPMNQHAQLSGKWHETLKSAYNIQGHHTGVVLFVYPLVIILMHTEDKWTYTRTETKSHHASDSMLKPFHLSGNWVGRRRLGLHNGLHSLLIVKPSEHASR